MKYRIINDGDDVPVSYYKLQEVFWCAKIACQIEKIFIRFKIVDTA